MTTKTKAICKDCKQGYTREGYAAYPDHIELCPLHAAAPETAAERDRLKKINADLLEALKLVRNGMVIRSFQKGGISYGGDRRTITQEAWDAVEAVIAKAEGGK